MIRFDRFSKSYKAGPVIAASLELPVGIYWLKGENGSGKTTLLRSIAGLMPHDGTITIDGVSMLQRVAYRLQVNYAEAEPVYPPFVTGKELIQFHEQARKADPLATKELVDALGAGSYLHNQVGTYSSGMLKKLSLILGFTGRAGLILLDEPLITLDVASVDNLLGIIQQRHARGTGFIVTSHQELTLDKAVVRRLAIEGKQLVLKT